MKNKKMLVFGILVLTIISLSIGYSSYKSDLKITGIASNVRPITDIRVTSMSLETDSTGLSTYNEYNYDRIITGFSVSNNQYMKYKVKVTNIGTEEMAITDISGVPDTLNLELENYSLNEKICNDNNECKLGITKEFYIKLSGKQFSSVTDPLEESYNLNLIFTFKSIHKVNYINIENNNYPTEIVDGGELVINFGENASSNLIVKMDGVEVIDYTYENGILRVPNVTGDVTIENLKLSIEYQEVEYIESTGTQYIDTGYIPNNKTEIELVVSGISSESFSVSTGTWFFGARVGYLNSAFGSYYNPTEKKIYYAFGNIMPSASYSSLYDSTKTIKTDTTGLYIDETKVVNIASNDFVAPVSLTLFALNNNGDVISHTSYIMHSCKIYDTGQLVRDFVPCYRKSDNVVGMYDLVNDVFYTNQGTGEFNKGNDV